MVPVFTSENRRVVIENRRVGMSVRDAVLAAGVSWATFTSWRRRARREPDGAHAEFFAELELASPPRVPAVSEPMSHEEFRERLEVLVRRGSVQACKLWWTAFGAGAASTVRDPFEDFDRLRDSWQG